MSYLMTIIYIINVVEPLVTQCGGNNLICHHRWRHEQGTE